MKFQMIEEVSSEFPVEKMCQSLGVSRSGYYAWLVRPESKLKQENEQILQEIRRIRLNKPDKLYYGSPRITDELLDNGYPCSEKRVARIMRKAGIFARQHKKFKHTTDSEHDQPVADNLLDQNFEAEQPNQIWVSDITYIWTEEGWLYLAAFLDLFSRAIVGWAVSERINKELVLQALNNAIVQRNPGKGLIIHSDRGKQYASEAFRILLKNNKFRQSMSGAGNCYDNAVIESFWHTIKAERIYWSNYKTREEAKKDIFDYIEIFYNRERRHSKIGNIAPAKFEKNFMLAD
jgi:transposase InsO family protein